MTLDTFEEESLITRPSSWHAALAQLPGFVAADPIIPAGVFGVARAVSLWEEGDEERVFDDASIDEPVEEDDEFIDDEVDDEIEPEMEFPGETPD